MCVWPHYTVITLFSLWLGCLALHRYLSYMLSHHFIHYQNGCNEPSKKGIHSRWWSCFSCLSYSIDTGRCTHFQCLYHVANSGIKKGIKNYETIKKIYTSNGSQTNTKNGNQCLTITTWLQVQIVQQIRIRARLIEIMYRMCFIAWAWLRHACYSKY